MSFGDGALTARITQVLPDGNRLVKFEYEGIFLEVLERLGKMPLRPISRKNSRTGSGIRRYTLKKLAPPPRPPQVFISPRNCSERSKIWE